MRMYTTTNGIEVPSVTTILNCVSVDGIAKWANYLGFKHLSYEAELQLRANRGTNIHSLLQEIVDPGNCKDPFSPDPYDVPFYDDVINNFKAMIYKYDYETMFTEKTLISEKLGYGGTFDWLAKLNGFTILFDFKSSSKVNAKHIMQLAAYKKLLEDQTDYRIDGAGVIIANEKTSSMYIVNNEKLDYLGLAFECLVNYTTLYGGELVKQDLTLKKTLSKPPLK